MYDRPFIREGDTVAPGGGIVKPAAQRYSSTYDGALACYEGDPVYCNTCKSWGVTRCVPPYRPHTDSNGRQANLDGDLCICKCPASPRLKALHRNNRMEFSAHELAGMPGAMNWLVHAGHAESWDHHDQHFLVQDENGAALANMPYRITSADGTVITGRTDAQGRTDRVFAFTTTQLRIEVPYYGDIDSAHHADDESGACGC